MSHVHSRAAGGTLALLIAAVLAIGASAHVQAQSTGAQHGGVPATSTACGAGRLVLCGETTVQECEVYLAFLGVVGPYLTPVFMYKELDCTTVDRRLLYKDV